MSRRSWSVFVLLASAAGCSRSCDPPPSIASGCWSHPGAAVDDTMCSTGQETEPNGDLVAANVVPDGSCAMQYLTGEVSNDIDVFRANGARCSQSSALQASLTTDQDDVRLCLFAACDTGKTGLVGCDGSLSPGGQKGVPNHMPEGVLGCCRVGQGTLSVNVNCDTDYSPLAKTPHWQSYLVVDRVRDTACTSYKVGYQF